MEKPTKVEIGSRWLFEDAQSLGVFVVIGCRGNKSSLGPDYDIRFEDGNGRSYYSESCILTTGRYLGGPQPSPEVPPAWVIGERWKCGTLTGTVVEVVGEEGWIRWDTDRDRTYAYTPAVREHMTRLGPTTPLVPLEGKEPVGTIKSIEPDGKFTVAFGGAPQGKPHDWDRYCVNTSGLQLCVACGAPNSIVVNQTCTPDAGWRQAHEERISDAQTAADEAKASATNWIQTRKGTQARLPEGRFQSHCLGAGLGVWSLREKSWE